MENNKPEKEPRKEVTGGRLGGRFGGTVKLPKLDIADSAKGATSPTILDEKLKSSLSLLSPKNKKDKQPKEKKKNVDVTHHDDISNVLSQRHNGLNQRSSEKQRLHASLNSQSSKGLFRNSPSLRPRSKSSQVVPEYSISKSNFKKFVSRKRKKLRKVLLSIRNRTFLYGMRSKRSRENMVEEETSEHNRKRNITDENVGDEREFNTHTDVNNFNNNANDDNSLQHIDSDLGEYAVKEKRTKLSALIRLAFGAPNLSTLAINMLLGIHGNLYYEYLGAPLSMIAFFTALARSVDVITDPLMSWMTDSTRTSFGRRKPYMLAGCIPYAIGVVFLLGVGAMFPSLKFSDQIGYYYGIIFVGFYLCDTFCNVPYNALGPELTDDYHERNRLYFAQSMFGLLGTLIGAVCPPLFESFFKAYGLTNTTVITGQGNLTMISNLTNRTRIFTSNFTNSSNNYNSSNVLTNSSSNLTNGSNSNTSSTVVQGNAKELSFLVVAIIFGAYYVMSILNLTATIKERPLSQAKEHSALVPSLVRCFNNKAFRILVVTWFLDNVGWYALSATLPFYLKYVIIPRKYETMGMMMEDEAWLAISLFLLFFTALVSSPLWYLLTKRYSKRNCWLLYNIFTTLTNLLFLFCSEGTTFLVLIVTILNGIPMGGMFLNDSLLADTIDYDEFLCGERREAQFTMFKSFIPKMVAIPAQAIPLALIYSFGFEASRQGVSQDQPESVRLLIQTIFVVWPVLLNFTSFFVKLFFPIRTKEQVELLAEGIVLHSQNFPARDPLVEDDHQISMVEPPLVYPKGSKEHTIHELLDHFSRSSLKSILEVKGDTQGLLLQTNVYLVIAVFFFILCILGVALTSKLLLLPLWSWLPSLFQIIAGISLLCILFQSLCLRAALELDNLEETDIFKVAKDIMRTIHSTDDTADEVENNPGNLLNHFAPPQSNSNPTETSSSSSYSKK